MRWTIRETTKEVATYSLSRKTVRFYGYEELLSLSSFKISFSFSCFSFSFLFAAEYMNAYVIITTDTPLVLAQPRSQNHARDTTRVLVLFVTRQVQLFYIYT
jgi:hypothetical protein